CKLISTDSMLTAHERRIFVKINMAATFSCSSMSILRLLIMMLKIFGILYLMYMVMR
ncbi:hypothetical protein L9F63_003510, partial [Diploptera punctata]